MGRRIGKPSNPFTYPVTRHIRKHGPYGYTDYESYRDWLRDEYSFRCVFCLKREQWELTGTWDIDHSAPQSSHPQDRLNYENLLYVCHRCNITKNVRIAPDPCQIAFGQCLQVHEDGTIEALNPEGELLVANLRLDSAKRTESRYLIISLLRSLFQSSKPQDKELYIQLMRYPDDLPDLSRLRPPGGNRRPEGVNESFYARRMRGELEETY